MTIKECIDLVDNLKPNSYSIEDKVNWLSFIDMTIINDVLKTHEGYDGRYDDFTGYSPDKLSAQLIVPSPYDRLYTSYLAMKIDEHNGETARYNNSAMMFNSYMAEFRKWYNKLHRPIPFGRKSTPTPTKNLDVTDAQMEALRRLIYAELHEDMLKEVSDDKIYDIVMTYVQNNAQMLNGADGKDGRDGKDGANGRDGKDGANGIGIRETSLNSKGELLITFTSGEERNLGEVVSEDRLDALVRKYLEENTVQSRIGYAELLASGWMGNGSLHKQIVDIEGVTINSQVDLTPSAEQLAIFYEKDISFVTENENGVVTVYAIGQCPQNDYRIQVPITEVQYE